MPDRDTAVAVVNHLGRWLPTLLALSGNSPFDGGADTGHDSWRMVQQTRFPGSGVAPWFDGYAAHRAEIARLVDCGVIVDENQTFWLARPAPKLPTVELRIADTASTVDEAVLQALLARALVRTALDALERGDEARPLRPQVASAAVWTAARYGLHGPAVDPVRAARVPAGSMVKALLSHVTDALEDAGDLRQAQVLLGCLRRDGTGARRQREAAKRGPRAVIQMLMTEATPGA